MDWWLWTHWVSSSPSRHRILMGVIIRLFIVLGRFFKIWWALDVKCALYRYLRIEIVGACEYCNEEWICQMFLALLNAITQICTPLSCWKRSGLARSWSFWVDKRAGNISTRSKNGKPCFSWSLDWKNFGTRFARVFAVLDSRLWSSHTAARSHLFVKDITVDASCLCGVQIQDR